MGKGFQWQPIAYALLAGFALPLVLGTTVVIFATTDGFPSWRTAVHIKTYLLGWGIVSSIAHSLDEGDSPDACVVAGLVWPLTVMVLVYLWWTDNPPKPPPPPPAAPGSPPPGPPGSSQRRS